MRIIGGKYSRRIFRPPANLPVRPTTDLARESLFNILEQKTTLEESNTLDLFSGTGAIAYEFASRGCRHALAVEKNFRCVQFIRDTALSFGMDQIKVIKADVFRYLQSTSRKFDIIFADPPYALENIPEIRDIVFERELLLPGGWLVIEHPAEVDLS
ncbi:MAG: RsmD family RNA methyltransferase, partial [bacterium]